MTSVVNASIASIDAVTPDIAVHALDQFQMELWQRLVAAVDLFNPDIVVLVARKMPRLYELFRLEFPPGALVISDLAMPFCHQYFRGARVAILDDVINVGSTIANARHRALAYGALETHAFALAGRSVIDEGYVGNYTLAQTEQINLTEVGRLGARIPTALSLLPKPYDLDFPLIPCRPRTPLSSASDLYHLLRESWPIRVVHRLGDRQLSQYGLNRFAIPMANREGDVSKIRIYASNDEWCLVPMALRSPLPHPGTFHPRSELAQSFVERMMGACANTPKYGSAVPYDAHIRVALFAASLDLGLSFMGATTEYLSPLSPDFMSIDDARLNFGPAVEDLRGHWNGFYKIQGSLEVSETAVAAPRKYMTILSGPDSQKIIDRIFDGIDLRSLTTLTLMARSVEILAQHFIGAASPQEYCLSWPYSQDEVREQPYRRLRVGFTVEDFVTLVLHLQQRTNQAVSRSKIREEVSRFLDVLVDSGTVVPAICEYDDTFSRIYRKGESQYRDTVADRVSYGWNAYGGPLSLTRATKLLSILAFSSGVSLAVEPMFREHGVVAGYEPAVSDKENPEITYYLRRIGKLTRVP